MIDLKTLISNSWCRGGYYELLPGRFLNRPTTGVLCHNRENGLFSFNLYRIILSIIRHNTLSITNIDAKFEDVYHVVGKMSYIDGNLETTVITRYEDWCTSMNNQKLLVGDWNGDRFTDLLCHKQTGHMKILLNQGG